MKKRHFVFALSCVLFLLSFGCASPDEGASEENVLVYHLLFPQNDRNYFLQEEGTWERKYMEDGIFRMDWEDANGRSDEEMEKQGFKRFLRQNYATRMVYKNEKGYRLPLERERIRGKIQLTFNPFSFSKRNCAVFAAPDEEEEILFVISLENSDRKKCFFMTCQELPRLREAAKASQHRCLFTEDSSFKRLPAVEINIPAFEQLQDCPEDVSAFIERQFAER